MDSEALGHLDHAVGGEGVHDADGDGVDGLSEGFAEADLLVAVTSVVVLWDPAFSVLDDSKESVVDKACCGVLAGFDGGGVEDRFEGRAGWAAGLYGPIEGALPIVVASNKCANKAGLWFKKDDRALEGRLIRRMRQRGRRFVGGLRQQRSRGRR